MWHDKLEVKVTLSITAAGARILDWPEGLKQPQLEFSSGRIEATPITSKGLIPHRSNANFCLSELLHLLHQGIICHPTNMYT